MEKTAFLLLILTFSSTVNNIHAAKIWEPGTNEPELQIIWLKGARDLDPNDITYNDKTKEGKPVSYAAVDHKLLKDILAHQRKLIQNDATDNVYTVLAEDDDKILDFVDLKSLKSIESVIQEIPKFSGRRSQELRQKAKNKGIKEQQQRKLQEIKNFMDDNYRATDYFYYEINRIRTDRVIKDPLREMVDYLSRPNMENLLTHVFECFQDRRIIDGPPRDIWKGRVPNNLKIDVLDDY